jgi:ergothioneine biosynthesis protein EgtB
MSTLLSKYKAVRSLTTSLAAPMSAEDQMVQSCPEASPMKWHQAHTTWFFETFILRPLLPGYKPLCEYFRRIFNSYYNSLGDPIPDKPSRAFFSRPSLDEILAYRRHVDAAIETILVDPGDGELERRVVLGLNHEQQHQELMLTDIKHAMFSNPLRPAYCNTPLMRGRDPESLANSWHDFRGGLVEIGCSPDLADAMDFCYDNERPRHKIYLESFRISGRGVTCREYLNFMADEGYARPELWLSEGWDTVRREGWRSPLYWERDATDKTGWRVFTLKGSQPLSSLLDTAVCHVSCFEADAFAKWSGCRLPTEQEWEFAASESPIDGNFLETGRLHTGSSNGSGVDQFFGDCWDWTASAYTAYPGYIAPPGAFGEYNGKFMSGQMILRGGSCVTSASHIRATYRNFFQPATRWQFSGIRLAADGGQPS